MSIPKRAAVPPSTHTLRCFYIFVVPSFRGLRVSRFLQGSGTKLADIPIGEWVAQKLYHGFSTVKWLDGVWSRILYVVRCLFNHGMCLFPLLKASVNKTLHNCKLSLRRLCVFIFCFGYMFIFQFCGRSKMDRDAPPDCCPWQLCRSEAV